MRATIKMSLLERSDCQRIHDASMDVLKERGIVFGNEMALDLVEAALSSVPKTFRWLGRDDDMSLNINDRGERTGKALWANRIWKERIATAPETMLDPELDKELKSYMDKAFSH